MSDRLIASVAAIAVGLIAFAVRIPSCYESFWVDELHSTWCVWGSLGDVLPRASVGNQSPLWFVLLWFWKQIAGESELGLRMISVLATSAASMSLCYCLAKKNSTTAGIAAGLVLALESNAIFFGTELRPYAFVILIATLACCCLLVRERPVAWTAILATIAIWMQPTSVAVMAGLIAIAVWQQRKNQMPWTRSDRAWLGFAIISMSIVIWTVLLSAWETRDRWSSFAVAPDFVSAIGIWSWTWLWLTPVVLIGITYRTQPRFIFAMAGLCVIVVFAFWLASRTQTVHLWHRRYFIALLPVFAILVGCSVSFTRRWTRYAWIPASVIVIGLATSQGTIKTLATAPHHLAYRGEDWRGAIAHMSGSFEKVIHVDAGLIEARGYVGEDGKIDRSQLNDLMREYLTCVVRGPYQLGGVIALPQINPRASERGFLTRSVVESKQLSQAARVTRFGSVTSVERASQIRK